MPYAKADGVNLYYEETGSGNPIIFVHEFAGDYRSWEPQVQFFSRRYRCITFNARGYPPSDVPTNTSAYSQERAVDDIACVLRHLKIDKAHVVGLSMGAFAALYFALRYPQMTRSAVVAAGGYGTKSEQQRQFIADCHGLAERFETQGSQKVAEWYAVGAYRVQFKAKNPRGWEEFRRLLGEHSAQGMALTMRGVQSHRPSFWDLKEDLGRMAVPVLIVSGDEDDWCLEPSIFLKRTIPTAGLWIMPKTGHTINLEEPETFNHGLWYFFDMVEDGRWTASDRRVTGASALLSGEQQTEGA